MLQYLQEIEKEVIEMLEEIEELEHMFQHRHFPSAIKRQAIAVDNARHTLTNALEGTVISP